MRIRDVSCILLALFILFMSLSACADAHVNGKDDDEASLETDTSHAQGTVTPNKKSPIPDDFDASGLNKYLIRELTAYLQSQYIERDMPGTSFSIKLDEIKKYDKQPMLVKFDPENYYYACAYFNPAHEYNEHLCGYACVNEYIWVKFASAAEILESYDGLAFVCAFQINKAEFCRDIRALGPSETVEHYRKFTPEFVEGLNVAATPVFDQSFIYLNSSNYQTVYHSVDLYNHDWITLECVEIEGQSYIPFFLRTEYANGACKENDSLAEELGVYYDDIMRSLIMDRYSVHETWGGTTYYGLIAADDLLTFLDQ